MYMRGHIHIAPALPGFYSPPIKTRYVHCKNFWNPLTVYFGFILLIWSNNDTINNKL